MLVAETIRHRSPLNSRRSKHFETEREVAASLTCSANEIAAISGHATLREVERYTKAVDQERPDEKVLAYAMNRHGQAPVVVRTGSGKFHALYRFNNERRAIRPWDDKPIDLLGAGLAIAPPSRVAKGQYQVIQGRLR
jgi:hypothetical protein